MKPDMAEILDKCQQSADMLDSDMRELYCAMVRENPLAAQLFLPVLKHSSELDNALSALQSILVQD